MNTFIRQLNTALLTPEVVDFHPWFRDLLRLWRPAGVETETVNGSMAMLRLAIRNGYVNFYCGGQSVAKVNFGRDRFIGEIHHKYLPRRPDADPAYVRTTSPQWSYVPGDVVGWMQATGDRQGAEKKFVERIVAANPNVIDLEMGLPAQQGKNSATRMDIVALEKLDDGWQVVFWEAKMVGNPEARSKGGVPRVIAHQRQNYLDWLADDRAKESVLDAYRNACCLLAKLHKFANEQGLQIKPLGDDIQTIASNRDLLKAVDDEVRLIIDNTSSDTHFIENHLPRLRGIEETTFNGMPVQIVNKGERAKLLRLDEMKPFERNAHK